MTGVDTVASSAGRAMWIDVARGSSMILVTIFHATFITSSAYGDGAGLWPEINEALIPIRMPLFFFVSGLLAASAIHRPLSATRRRTLGYVYLYLLWSFIQLLFDLYLAAERGDPRPSAAELLVNMVLPTGLWFLWALAAYFAIARLAVVVLGRHAAWASVGALAVAAMLPFVDELTAGAVDPFFGVGFFGSVCANFVWFYIGLFARSWTASLMSRPSVWKSVIGVSAYLAVYAVARAAGVAYESRWILSVVALWAALQVLALVPERGRIVRALAAVGRRTLPVYVMQWAALFLVSKAVVEFPILPALARAGGDSELLASIASPAITLVVVASTWFVGKLVVGSPARWLLEAPRWLVGNRPASAVPLAPAAPTQPAERTPSGAGEGAPTSRP